ncbi:DoxX family protein [Tenacibaculum caenipelagi]|uniref:Putative membrane protein n=1 Tax=Tenacibaculum caenipelagi TaxID=1325435 RepID=A0A4R6TJ50_9FLAO|nr:MauE/DoxX family redox-associated membrane protein [Tenacibaculum caenipelagi]TDQ30161.1 putative membrane protein [Tenacibaculum caenipelagi]
MEILILILRIIFGLLLGFAGVMHFVKPKVFNRFIPPFLPKLAVNYIAGFFEFTIGICLLINQTAKQAALAMFVLMLIFLPIHIWDVFREKPAIGSKKIAIIRVLLQFLLLYIAYLIYTH